MNTKVVDTIARTVLYEGYLLYPYRPTALKNRMRFTFGGLYPPSTRAARAVTNRHSCRQRCSCAAIRPLA